jgi:hypothetical protein
MKLFISVTAANMNGAMTKQGTICTPLAKRLNAAFLFCAIFQKISEKGIL